MKVIIHLKILILTVLLISCNKNEEYITPNIQNISESVYASGVIKSKNQYEVFSKMNGIISKVNFIEGNLIKKGEILLEIESETSKYALKNALLNSNYSDYNANLEKLQDAEKSVLFAKQKLSNDSLLFIRQKNLWDKNIGTKVEFEQKELNYENAKLNYNSSLTKLNDLRKLIKLQSEQTKNNLAISKIQEGDYSIKSEIDGVIYKIYKEKGEFINNMSPIAILGSNDFEIELNIDENDITKVKKGQKVFVKMDSYKNQVFEAILNNIDPLMNPKTRAFRATADFKTKPEVLYPNLTAETNILINSKENTMTIPRNYLINDSTIKLNDGSLKTIKIGLMDYEMVEVLSGLDKNSKLVKPE